MLETPALQVQTSEIVQRLCMHTSMRPASAVLQAGNAGAQWQSSILPRNSAAVRASQGVPGRAALMSRGSLAQQHRGSPAGLPSELPGRASMAANHQRNIDMAARRAAGHSTQMLSSRKTFVPAAVSSPSKHAPASLGAEHCKDSSCTPAADQVSAGSPFLSVVLESQD